MVTDNLVDNDHQAKAADNITNSETPKIHKIPRKIVLDSLVVIKVEKRPSKQMIQLGGPGYTGFGPRGLWDDFSHTIFINTHFDDAEQWTTFRHELIHAIIDTDNEIINCPEYKEKLSKAFQRPANIPSTAPPVTSEPVPPMVPQTEPA